jgi:iron complex outermembrane receptor protein
MKKFPMIVSIMGAAVPALVLGQTEDNTVGFELEEIVVTAQRRAETLQDAALPVNAATGDQLLAAGITDAVGLGRISPALTVNNGGGANTGYFVRGVGNFNNNGYTNPAVAFNLDGVYVGRPSSTVASFLDLDRVEVLKGPQGTLYGRNATGGAINVQPNRPELGENSGSVSAEGGNFGKGQITGVYNAAVGDNSAFRFAATYNELDGWYDDDTGAVEDTALRAQYYSEVSDTFNFRVSADWANSSGNGQGVDVIGVYGFNPSPAGRDLPIRNWGFTSSGVAEFSGLHDPGSLSFIADNATAAPLFNTVEGYAFPERDDTFWGVNAELNFDLGFADLVVIPAYRFSELDNVFNGPPFKAAINQDEAEQITLEARLSGETDSLEWILGAYYFDESVEGANSFNQFATESINSFDSNVESYALFARGSFSLTDDTRLVGGLRWTTEDRSMDAQSFALAAVCLDSAGPNCNVVAPTIPVANTLDEAISTLVAQGDLAPGTSYPFPPGPPPRLGAEALAAGGPPPGPAILSVNPTAITEEDSESEVTYRIALEHDLGDESLLYASFETGFRAGGFNLTAGRETYDGETIDAFTIGSKNRFMDNRLELNFEAFLWQYDNQILAALGVDVNGDNSFYSRNVGESTNQGIEVNFQFLAAENTLIRGGIQLLDTEYDEFTYNQVDLSDDEVEGNDVTDDAYFLTPITGCNATQVLPTGSTAAVAPGDAVVNNGDLRSYNIDCSGEEALFSPDTSINLGIDQTFDLDNGALIASLDLRYRAERWVGFGFIEEIQRADEVTTVDASINYKGDNGVSVLVYGRNLTDEYIPGIVQVGAGSVAGQNNEPPRTFGVRVQYDF